jgi:hypothetical protein
MQIFTETKAFELPKIFLGCITSHSEVKNSCNVIRPEEESKKHYTFMGYVYCE